MTTPLAEILAPRSIAIVGASDNPDKAGGRPVHFLKRFGFAGAIYPINPQRAEVQGLPSFASLAALPEVPDVTVIVVAGVLIALASALWMHGLTRSKASTALLDGERAVTFADGGTEIAARAVLGRQSGAAR